MGIRTWPRKIVVLFRDYGFWAGLQRLARIAGEKFVGPLVWKGTFVIFCARPSTTLRKQPANIAGLQVREVRADATSALLDLWPAEERGSALENITQRFRVGDLALAGEMDGRIVSLVWITAAGEKERLTGLQIQLAAGACYVSDMRVDIQYRRRGIALAMAGKALETGKQRGFQRGYMFVSGENQGMLRLVRDCLNLERVGMIRTTWLFRRPYSAWEYGGRRKRGGGLVFD